MDPVDSVFYRAPASERNDVFAESPLLKGQTRFEPLPDMNKIMITGGAGFIGSWVARHLTLTYGESYHVIVFDNLEYPGSISNIRQLQGKHNFHFVYGDIRSSDDVFRCLSEFEIDTVLHFAAKSHVGKSFDNPFGFTMTNVLGTQTLLHAAKDASVRRFLYFSTDEVYGEPDTDNSIECTEATSLCPKNPYAGSKAAADVLVRAYAASFKLPVLVVRSNNVYGPHQYPEKIIPRFALPLHLGLPLPLHGPGLNTRRYVYASDLCDAIDTILHRATAIASGGPQATYNITSRDEVSNLQICQRLLASFGITEKSSHKTDGVGYSFNPPSSKDANGASGDKVEDRWIKHTCDRPANDQAYLVDGRKLEALGWKQRVSAEEGFARTVEWYRMFGLGWWGGVQEVLGDLNMERVRRFGSAGDADREDAADGEAGDTNGEADGVVLDGVGA
ncbi:MAG: hypothetical protein M1831_000899 [Alyxoria varia]|nr:MAG: hypothetical protein M1831_000899 [Alyxoria varia]